MDLELIIIIILCFGYVVKICENVVDELIKENLKLREFIKFYERNIKDLNG